MRKIYLSLVVIYFIKTAEACTCVPAFPHPQREICENQYVVKGSPTSVIHESLPDVPLPNSIEEKFNFDNYKHRHYFFEVSKDFKDSGLEDSIIVITTPGSSGRCGLMLYNFGENPRDREWLITGTIDEDTGRFNAEQCLLHKPWEQVTKKQRDFLNNGAYLNNCGCSIIECVEGGDCDPHPTNECVHYEPDFDDCYIKDLHCKRTGNGKCSWKGRNKNECTDDNPVD